MLGILIALGFGGALALGVAIGGLLGRAGSQPASAVQSAGRIVWSFDQPAESYCSAMTTLNDQEVRIIGFQAHGKNTSTDPISEFSGLMRSDRTNEQRPIYLMARDKSSDPSAPSFFPQPAIPTIPEETFGIPGLADFDISTHEKPYIENGKDGVPSSQFLRDFGAFTVVLKYDGATYERHFSIEQIHAQLALFERLSRPQDAGAPRVTRKSTAKPAQPFPPLPAPELPLKPPANQSPANGG
jgi:hypothetical protein